MRKAMREIRCQRRLGLMIRRSCHLSDLGDAF